MRFNFSQTFPGSGSNVYSSTKIMIETIVTNWLADRIVFSAAQFEYSKNVVKEELSGFSFLMQYSSPRPRSIHSFIGSSSNSQTTASPTGM